MQLTKGDEPRLRIVTGRAEAVEAELGALMYDYTPTHWAFAAVGDHMEVTVVLLHDSEVRKQQLVAVPVNGGAIGRR
jgi:hypothetical protein